MTKRDGSHKSKGEIANRIQALNPVTRRWVKIDTTTASIIEHKQSPGPYKNIRKR
ncbi:MAG: hypothetical protein HYY29_00270 [Chloroflexi bacterium]|nr:hypothetical protein [Chloroflexota bacterium]